MADTWYASVAPGLTTSDFQYNLPVYYKKSTEALIRTPRGLWAAIDTEPFPKRSGTTATFGRIAEQADNVTPLTQGENPTNTAIETGSYTASIIQLGSVTPLADLVEDVTIEGIKMVPTIVGNKGRNSLENYCAQTVVPYLMPVRADLDSALATQVGGEFVTDGAGSATSLTSASLSYAGDNFYRYAMVINQSPDSGSFGRSRLVSASANSGDTLTVAAYQDYGTGLKFRLGGSSGLTTGDKISLTNLRYCRMLLENNGCFGEDFEIDGGGYNMVYSAKMRHDLSADSNIVNLFIYKEKEKGIRSYGTGGSILDFHEVLTARPYRHTSGSAVTTYVATGDVESVALIGRNAAAKLPLGKSDISIIIKPKEVIGGPLDMFSTVGYKITTAITYKNGNAGINLMCVPSA